MTSRIYRLPYLLLFFLTGCVMHAPMSETIIFNQSKAERFGVGFSGNLAATSQKNAFEEAKQRYFNPNRNLTRYNSHQRAASLYLASYSKKSGFSLTVGFPTIGVDYTYRLGEKSAFTASGSLRGGVQVILQRRLVKRRHFGGSLGVALRRELIWFSDSQRDCDAIFGCGESRSIPATSAGIRVMTVVAEELNRGLYGHVYVGYSPAFEQAVISFGVSVGAF